MKFATVLALVLLVAGAAWMSVSQGSPAAPAAAPATKAPVADSQPGVTMKASPRIAAVAKMAMEKKSSDKETLTKALSDPDSQVRRHAIYGLERIGDPASAKDIIPLLKDPDAFAQRGAAVSLGKLGNKEAVPALLEALSASDAYVRQEAFTALGRIADPATQGPILKAMQDDRLWNGLGVWEIQTVLQVITRDFFTDRGAIPVLKNLLTFDGSNNVYLKEANAARRAPQALLVTNKAAEILATKFGDASGEDALVAGLAADDYMQQSSADALGLLKSRKAVPGLVKMLSGEWTVNRRKAMQALGAIGDPAAVPELEKYLKAPAPAPDAPPASRPAGGPRGPRVRPEGEPDARLRALAAAMLEKIDGKKRTVDTNDPPASIPQIAPADLKTPGGKRPPVFICLGVDDCANIEGIEAMLDICETLKEKGSKAVFTLWLAPLASTWENRDVPKQTLIIQRMFDLGCEIANHTLTHNRGGIYWSARDTDYQFQAVEGAANWYRANLSGFTRPFTFKGGGGAASGTNPDPEFTRALMARQRFIYGGGRGNNRPARQAWTVGKQDYYRLDTGCLDAAAPPVHEVVTDPIYSDYSGRFDYEVPEGVAMWKANFEYRYNHPERPILAVNAFHDWGLRQPGGQGGKGSHRNEGAILKAFLLDVLVTNKDKYPETHCVTFRQVVEYIATDGDLQHTLAAGNCQDSRNPVKPKVD